jgi:hypothetical protein
LIFKQKKQFNKYEFFNSNLTDIIHPLANVTRSNYNENLTKILQTKEIKIDNKY